MGFDQLQGLELLEELLVEGLMRSDQTWIQLGQALYRY